MSSVQAFCIRQDFRGGMAFKHIRSKTAHVGLDLEQAHRPVIQEGICTSPKEFIATSRLKCFGIPTFSL